MTASKPLQLDAIERRFGFVAWPQACAHASWFEALDALVGLKVSRQHGPSSGVAEQAVAQALLVQVGCDVQTKVDIDCVPLWAMHAHGVMRRHLSSVAGLLVLPALKRVVNGEQIRLWDAVLGVQVRQDVLRLGRIDTELELPSAAQGLYGLALAAAKTAVDWGKFCLQLGLTALAPYGAAVSARVRLAWPQALSKTAPLVVDESTRVWLAHTCMKVSRHLPERLTPERSPNEGAA
jgi:hypothetical protein